MALIFLLGKISHTFPRASSLTDEQHVRQQPLPHHACFQGLCSWPRSAPLFMSMYKVRWMDDPFFIDVARDVIGHVSHFIYENSDGVRPILGLFVGLC